MEGLILIVPLVVIGFVAYVFALVNAARSQKWVWFVVTLLFWPAFIFYYIFAFESSPSQGKALEGQK